MMRRVQDILTEKWPRHAICPTVISRNNTFWLLRFLQLSGLDIIDRCMCGSHGSEYEQDYLLWCHSVQSGTSLLSNVLFPGST
jgi:hypothetical protein